MSLRSDQQSLRELRLFLEEICCDLCRFEHAEMQNIGPETIAIRQEVPLTSHEDYADILVRVPGVGEYFVEVKFGLEPEALAARLRRKYGGSDAKSRRVVVVSDCPNDPERTSLHTLIRNAVGPQIEIEICDQETLFTRINKFFGLQLDRLESVEDVLELRHALDGAKGRFAFDEGWVASDLQLALLWHFSFWRIRQLRLSRNADTRSIMPPGMYQGVVAILADLCSFSSYMRDTRDNELVRHCLTSFYAKARNAILNAGGMMLQFVGDEAIGLFGLPDHAPGYCEAALSAAESLASIGASVSHEWQRHLDRTQSQRGVHIGIAMGDLQIVSLRPFGRAHLGAVSDTINMAARLLSAADANEIVVSNSFFRKLPPAAQVGFESMEPVDARNVGRITAWRKPA